MDTTRMEMISKLYEGRTLVEVANQYNYTPSAISHMLKSVESELGICMFTRDRTRIIPTPEGRELYPYLSEVLNDYNKMKKYADSVSQRESGKIKISSFVSVVVAWMPDIINSFKKEYPNVNFEITQTNYRDTVRMIKNGEIDCGFTVEKYTSGIEYSLISEDKLYVVYPEGHPLGESKDFNLKMLEPYPFIVLNEGSENLVLEFLESKGIQVSSICTVADDYAACSLVESGIGLTIVPELFLYRSPYAIGSRCVDPDFSRRICLSYRKDYEVSPILSKFIEHVKQWGHDNPDIVKKERANRLIIDGDNSKKL